MPDQSLTVGARCRNHPDLGGLFVADMPASTAPYRQKVPLCAACGPRVEAIGFDVQPLDTGEQPHVHTGACTRTYPDCEMEPPSTEELLANGEQNDPPCRCGHARSDHHGDPGRGPCVVSTEAETWACTCNEYQPSSGDTRPQEQEG